MKQIRFTKEGFKAIKKEQTDLLSERLHAVDELQKARELGDLSENGLYKAARAKLSSIDSRLQRIKSQLTNPVVVSKSQEIIVGIGNSVKVTDGENEIFYHVVGDMEADPINNKISLLSPIGSAISGKQVGDVITIYTPSGKITYTILSIS